VNRFIGCGERCSARFWFAAFRRSAPGIARNLAAAFRRRRTTAEETRDLIERPLRGRKADSLEAGTDFLQPLER
jgi:hypothetical protein